MKKKLMAFGLVLSCVSPMAMAASNSGPYFGAQYVQLEYSEDAASSVGIDDFNPTGLLVKIGSRQSEHFGIEGRFAFGLSEDTQTFTNGFDTLEIGLKLDNLFGIYGVASAQVGESSEIYGLFGFTSIKLTLSAELCDPFCVSASDSDDDSDMSFGFGANIGMGEDTYLNVEYMSYYSEDGVDITALGFGVQTRF